MAINLTKACFRNFFTVSPTTLYIAIRWAMSDCFVWHSSVLLWHKQFSREQAYLLQGILWLRNPLSHVRLFCWVFFCSALTQTVLTRTVSSTEYKGHLQLKRSTAEWHINTALLCPRYSLQATELIYGGMTMMQSQSTCRYRFLLSREQVATVRARCRVKVALHHTYIALHMRSVVSHHTYVALCVHSVVRHLYDVWAVHIRRRSVHDMVVWSCS